MERIVLDGSVALAWCFTGEHNIYADAIAKRFPSVEAEVPGIWPLEMANAFLMGERRKRCTQSDTATWTAFLGTLPLSIDGETNVRAFGEILNLGRSHGLTSYDAAYLELAMRRGLPLAKLDDKLKAAAVSVGVSLYAAP